MLFFDGDGGIRTLVPRRANAFRVRPVMTTSIRLHSLWLQKHAAVTSLNFHSLFIISDFVIKEKP